MKLDCEVIRDLLPLYCEDIASSKSRKIVEEHCRECEHCKKELLSMTEGIVQIEDDGSRMKKFVKDCKRDFRALLAVYCYTALVLVGIIHGRYGIGPTDGAAVIIIYAMLLFPVVGFFCNLAIGVQKFKIKYIFPVVCGIAGAFYQPIALGTSLQMELFEVICFSINFIPAMIGLAIGVKKVKNPSNRKRKYNEGMMAGIAILVVDAFLLIVSEGALFFWLMGLGGVVILVVSCCMKKR